MMKKIFQILICGVIISNLSCKDDEKLPIENITDNVDTAGGLRTISVLSPTIDLNNIQGSEFSVEVEEWDDEDGDLLESVDVYVRFQDLTPDNGDSSRDEVLVANIPASDFQIDSSSGLPRAVIIVSAEESVNLLGLDEASEIDGGDAFRYRLVLKLKDGRTFSSNNAEGNISGVFFNSPFSYAASVVCSGDETFLVGDYNLVSEISNVGGVALFSESTVTVTAISDIRREINVTYIGDAGVGNGPVPFQFDLVCSSIVVPEDQSSGLSCSSGIQFGPVPPENISKFDTADDSEVTVTLLEDEDDDCGGGTQVISFTLTKI